MTLALFGSVKAAFKQIVGESKYIRDMMSEKTLRSFEKDASGKFFCAPGMTGTDCNQRICPYSLAFTAGKASEWMYTPSEGQETMDTQISKTNNGAVRTSTGTFENLHPYKECGGRGTCDRATGECKCFDSYSGEGCRRTSCPNDCSGHGTCTTDYNALYGQVNIGADQPGKDTHGAFWATKKMTKCICDRGYEGYDCSLRMCPRGDDPETECSDQLAHDIQVVTCTAPTGKKNAAYYFTLSFKDNVNGAYRTRPIPFVHTNTPAGNANAIQDALEALPNFAIPSVEINQEIPAAGGTATGAVHKFEIAFTDASNTNLQSLVSVDTMSDCASESQPLFENLPTANQVTCTVTRKDAVVVSELKESLVCGGRGLCDTSTGTCTCFDGYYGESCSSISTYV